MIASVRCPRLVGRAKETAFFRERLADAERGRGSLTFISGEAGIGKTRLVRDFLQLPELRRVPRAIGYCTEHAPSPLAPLADIIWSLLDEHPDLLVDAPITRRILARLVPSLAHENDEATVSIDVRAQYAALVDLFRRASERRPVIIAIDDAQWADLSTIAFVTFFAGRLAGTRAMMFVMQRLLGEGTDPLSDALARVRSNERVYTLALGPLPIGEMRRLSDLALGTGTKLSDDLLRQVFVLADGNPLFVEELLGTALSAAGNAVRLPASLRTLFLDRFSGLDVDDRETLTEAAVMGRSFDPVSLAQLTGRPIERILRTLRNARELQLVNDDGDGIVFRHALVRESLYASLLGSEARRLHRRMAEELESLPESMTRTAALAYHWWSARDPLKAFPANVIAGQRAMTQLATIDAALFFERALSCLSDNDAARAEIECRLGSAHFMSGFPDKATIAYTRALNFYRSINDMRKIAEVSIELGRQSAALGDGESSLRWRMDAIEAADRVLGDETIRFATFANVSFGLVVRGEFDRAREYIARAKAMETNAPFAARLELAEAEIFADYFSGLSERATERFGELHAAIASEGTPTQIVRISANRGYALGLIGNIESAITEATYAADQSDETMSPGYQIGAFGILGQLMLRAGNLAEAARRLADAERTIATFGQTSTRFTATLVPLGLGLGVHDAQPLLLARYGNPAILDDAFNSLEYPWFSNLTDAFVMAAVAAGNRDGAQVILSRALAAHPNVAMLPDLALQFAEFGRPHEIERAAELLARWPADMRALRAYRALFDCHVARRNGRVATGLARDAADRFVSLRLPLLAARSFELAGDEERALQLYTLHSASGDVARLRATRGESGARARELSARERDVLPHVMRGRSNLEIARDLNISERTVESHVRSILAKRGVKSRLLLVRSDSAGRADEEFVHDR